MDKVKVYDNPMNKEVFQKEEQVFGWAMECGEEFMEDVEKIKFNLVEYTDK